jgi:hypothetical protein
MIGMPWRAVASTQRRAVPLVLVALLGFWLAGAVRPAAAQSDFPNIPAWSFVGAWKPGAGADTIVARPRTLTLRWLRDPVAEARTEFGGYRIYRATSFGDTTTMVLLRRYSKQDYDRITTDGPYYLWHFPPINVGDADSLRVATFIDPDSAGRFVKVCRLRSPQNDPDGACVSRGDSVLLLVPPPGPHDGFRTWYSVTYEARNISSFDFQDEFIPDTGDNFARCRGYTNPDSCPNLNHKAANIANDVWEPRAASADPDSHFFAHAVEPTRGPTANLSRTGVVPNPYRASETWNPAGGHELHFTNLPKQATIRIYTLSGDLVRELEHADAIRDYEAWDLKNDNGRDVVSGIYLYRVEAGAFSFQSRFVVIR